MPSLLAAILRLHGAIYQVECAEPLIITDRERVDAASAAEQPQDSYVPGVVDR